MPIKFEFRDMSKDEYKREQSAFNENGIEFGNPSEKQERFGFVASIDEKFVGCSSGLAQKNNDEYGRYFYLSDLLVEKEHRRHGYGEKLLQLLEYKMKPLGIEYIWTWTAGYEAPAFYLKQGYEIFTSFENYYPSGHARVGFIKKL